MKRVKPFRWVDLFCGCGGMATGRIIALDNYGIPHEGWAINHCPFAVSTMHTNHPFVHTLEMDLETVVPSEVIPCRHLDHLHASPSCTHHSRAKGGRPRSNQLRSQPDLLTRWTDDIDISMISVENVPEFLDWGPLDYYGRPIKKDKGNCFKAWVGSLEARNYIVEWRIVNCADFGDATSRKRLFVKAVKRGRGEIRWPEPTHAGKWRGIRECLDLADTGSSIFDRDTPLARNTMRRIAIGAKRYWGIDLQPFIVHFNKNCDAESVDAPISCITTSGTHHALCTPIVLDHFKGGEIQDGSCPIGTQTTHDRFSVLQPLVLGQQGGSAARPIDEPCPTISCAGAIRGIFPKLADGRIIDIRMRMLRPDELAAAHSFPKGYIITGNRGQQVKQIGNSVPVRTAAAMMEADIRRGA